jgi:hypothetical protein
MQQNSIQNVRLATLDQLVETVLPNFISPVPSRETLRAWFDGANISRLKANAVAKRGGGPVYYSVAGVEKFFRSRLLPCRLKQPTEPRRVQSSIP